ncbi:MAG: NAD(P)H-dependent oxidoreductase subunit E [Bryobacteraceae bacterium]
MPVSLDRDALDRIIAQHDGQPGGLLSILEKVQERNPQRYLPMETLEYIAGRTDIPLSQIYSVVTFYALFNLEPQGRNTICICRGTACHTRGSRDLLDRIQLVMGVKSGEDGEGEADKLVYTTPDRKYTLRTVACFGQCALAPVVEINHHIYGHVNEQALHRELEALDKEKEK